MFGSECGTPGKKKELEGCKEKNKTGA